MDLAGEMAPILKGALDNVYDAMERKDNYEGKMRLEHEKHRIRINE